MDSIHNLEERRAFLRRAGRVGLGVPATALLLSVTRKAAIAKNEYKGNCGLGNGADPAPPGDPALGCGGEGARNILELNFVPPGQQN